MNGPDHELYVHLIVLRIFMVFPLAILAYLLARYAKPAAKVLAQADLRRIPLLFALMFNWRSKSSSDDESEKAGPQAGNPHKRVTVTPRKKTRA